MGGGDAGQAFPLYIMAVAALLFLALAFFAVGQAGARKNGTQTAADAAALAAAQDYREQLRTGLLTALGSGDGGWAEWLSGRGAEPGRACEAAASYAELNGAGPAITCGQGGVPGEFTVTVTSAETVGQSVVPGTESRHATATAKAEVAPRCTAEPVKEEPPKGGPAGGSTGGPAAGPTAGPTDDLTDRQKETPKNGPEESPARPDGAKPTPPAAIGLHLTCGDKVLVIGPERPDAVVKATDLYAVHLAD
ncbi:pilus assembly protein TadG-related protein [Streptomyces sp. NPDC026206]|uniref:pilus assembly protein TadG-related protein n=1 Tax=Streptomyces sp. NPDC026206 TaxID=3157089 RepID=UPI0033E4A7F9